MRWERDKKQAGECLSSDLCAYIDSKCLETLRSLIVFFHYLFGAENSADHSLDGDTQHLCDLLVRHIFNVGRFPPESGETARA